MLNDLRPVDVLGGAVRAAGIVELEPTDRGIVLHRMPAWARAQHNDIALAMLEGMPSGGRLEMVTDATTIEIDVHLTLVQLGTEPGPPAAFDLVVDDELAGVESTRTGTLIVIDRCTGAVDIQSGGSDTIRFDGLPPGEKRVEVWLPHASAVHLIELRADGAVRPPDPQRRASVGALRQLDLALPRGRPDPPGCGRWSRPAWPGSTCRASRFAGQCQLDPFAARMIGQQPADLISLKLGINIVNADSMRERTFVPGRPRLPRPGARPPSRRPAGGDHADHLPGGRGPPRSHGGRREPGSAR